MNLAQFRQSTAGLHGDTEIVLRDYDTRSDEDANSSFCEVQIEFTHDDRADRAVVVVVY